MIKDSPNAIEEEKKVLSAMMLKDGVIIPTVAEILQADDFYRPEHRIIFSALLKTYETGHCDPLLLLDELKSMKWLDRITDKYVLSLVNAEFSVHRAALYAERIKEKAQLRRLAEIGDILKETAEEGILPVSKILSQVDSDLQQVAKARKEPLKSLSDILKSNFEQLQQRMHSGSNFTGITTGFYALDRIINGLKKSDLLILAARPSMGKTALALNIATTAAKVNTVLFFSLEMSETQIGDRIISSASRVSVTRIARGTLTDGEFVSVVNELDYLAKLRLKIDDAGGLTLADLRMRAKQIKQKSDLGLIVIDYLQLMQTSSMTRDTRVNEISEISRGLKALAKELDIPILALSQLNRQVEMRAEKKPQLSDLRESGSLEQDADIVMFLYRDEYYNRDDTNNQNIAELIIAKNRNGATGSIKLYFEPEYQFFGDLTREG